ncbi:unnamed protein product [Rotaria sordida]|uniref:Uncharacterized protein n=1 Tax=Rotaria sordida TaxID=392033 RepID=A0A815AKZ2_9BILA|nr:unnamed protein product [Rotaria sordida]CAF1087849.1 unnamed protein product [Rotaria sordida]CAF1255639.1 unnamed protein product [Rotaria sordida]CAF1255967.1 unnamed protein product [Rotaria sordida]CAF3568748.1 unnamed protein product [Rotaria sordida]
MSDKLLFLSSTMSNKHERIREIKYHINQLLSELHMIEPNNDYLENFRPFNITINSSSKIITNEKCLLNNQCPYLFRKQTKLHSTTYHEYRKFYRRKKYLILSPKKNPFITPSCVTSTPKNSPNQNKLLQPHLTSTPRHNKRQSKNIIPLKRLIYNNNNDKFSNRQRHSTKRSILPHYSPLNPIDENPQWI